VKKIKPFPNDDNAELHLLAENKRLGSYPDLRDNLQVVESQYQAYVKNGGNPWFIKPCELPDKLQGALEAHYELPPQERLVFIDKYRRDLSPDVCPMCGSFGTGTLDHYLPKTDYAEFAIFSQNLVPACSCNSLRNTTVKGDAAPKRVIHPYFDCFLNDRLFKAVFSCEYEAPSITVDVVNPAHPNIDVLKFHLDEVMLKNHIVSWFDKTWSNLHRRPHMKLKHFLPAGELDSNSMKESVSNYLETKDEEYDTPNNWWSIFYYGLLMDECRLAVLVEQINALRE